MSTGKVSGQQLPQAIRPHIPMLQGLQMWSKGPHLTETPTEQQVSREGVWSLDTPLTLPRVQAPCGCQAQCPGNLVPAWYLGHLSSDTIPCPPWKWICSVLPLAGFGHGVWGRRGQEAMLEFGHCPSGSQLTAQVSDPHPPGLFRHLSLAQSSFYTDPPSGASPLPCAPA